ncbi:gfo/Idh/MocA family oxidoreductase [Maribellus comscasis]|uniref:Gfo/Idh/MocA family oxidoreductase n=1 Tax=Maribellus comscasis TaxID=2681766 RepID=A0A6I6JXY3_9BACT|nr:Gfo/Idh/MocA family oxidoreductase [Maribellus comscasis]QGY47411.1 gfo/Idh/MocA family oxidoreductase [Maribellus comscasis]
MNSRRKFIKRTAGALGAFTVVPGHVLFAKPEIRNAAGELVKPRVIAPSDKINMAFCGIGNRGGQILQAHNSTGMINTTVLCDVDMGAKHTVKSIEDHPKAKQYQDFREMFEKSAREFDAVCVGTPDFSHFPITILAMSQGKHVYVEKPLTRTFYESELLIEAAKKYGVVTQMGNQGHSEGNYYQFKSWVENGIIKDVTRITAHMNGRRRWHDWDVNIKKYPVNPVIPETLDWDTWLMTAEEHGYHEDFVNGQWRCWYEHGMGALGDWGAHIIDTAHQFLELGLPFEVDPIKIKGHNKLFFPMESTLAFKFPKRKNMPACTITWYDGMENIPQVPEGFGEIEVDPNIPPASNGVMQPAKLGAGKEIYGKDLTFKGGSHGSTLSIIPPEAAKDMESKLPEVPESPSNHFENFHRAIQGTEKTNSPFEISGPLSQVFCLGTIAQRLNTKIEFDRKEKQITNNKLANELLKGTPPRKGWEEFYKL